MGANLLDRRMAQLRAQAYMDNRANGLAVQQMCFDAALIALHDEFGFGHDRAVRFKQALAQTLDEMADLIIDDPDPAAIESRARIDRKLGEILGSDLEPWEGRYKAQISTTRNRAERRAGKKKRRRDENLHSR